MPPTRHRKSAAQRGQSITEFALVAPLLLFLAFGVLEASLLLFTIGSARYAAGEGARTVAELGTAATADTAAVQVVQAGALGQTGLASVSHVDIYRLTQQSGGQLAVDTTAYNSYRPDGSAISVTWPPASRGVKDGATDFVGMTIYYQYSWKSGALLGSGPLQLSQTYYLRLEPQSY